MGRRVDQRLHEDDRLYGDRGRIGGVGSRTRLRSQRMAATNDNEDDGW